MNFKKVLALALALLLAVTLLAACNKDGTGGDNTEATNDESQDVTLTVSIKVKDIDGNVVYDVPSYIYSGKAPTPTELIDDYFYMESDSEDVETDEYGDIIAIGSVSMGDELGTDEAGAETVVRSTYWWWTLNGKEASKGMDDYIVQDGDAIEFFLKLVPEQT